MERATVAEIVSLRRLLRCGRAELRDQLQEAEDSESRFAVPLLSSHELSFSEPAFPRGANPRGTGDRPPSSAEHAIHQIRGEDIPPGRHGGSREPGTFDPMNLTALSATVFGTSELPGGVVARVETRGWTRIVVDIAPLRCVRE